MARYTPESKERVRDAVDMVELVSARTELKRAGANRYTGLCPFHDERTPSFGINPVEKVYYCFGCQAAGDAFTFVMETEGVDFKGSLEVLADRFNIQLELEQEDPQAAERRQRRDRLLELLERTAAFYVRVLWESTEAARARDYLAKRGLEEGTLREFRVGYAPSAWDTVLVRSRRAGFSDAELRAAAVAQKSQKSNQSFDRFRSQIMFPLADARGRVLGFAGRTLGDDRRPKYINSPEGDLFHKGRQLFGADLARGPAAKAGSVVVAEGYTDVLAMHQAGLRNCVGIMGTALTEDQVGELARLAPVVQLALDADSAGQDAMLRAAKVAAQRKLELRVVALPGGEDPADLVQGSGGEEMERLVGASVPFLRFRVQRTLDTGDLEDAQGKDRVVDRLRSDFALLPPSVERAELLKLASDRMDVSPDLLETLLAQKGAGRPAPGARESSDPGPMPGNGAPRRAAAPLSRRERTERAFLAFCVALPDLGAPALAALDLDADLTTPVGRRAAEHLRAHLAAPTEGLPDDDPELAALVYEISVRAAAPVTPARFEIERLQLALARLEREIRVARGAGEGDVATLAARRTSTQAELSVAMERAMVEGSPRG